MKYDKELWAIVKAKEIPSNKLIIKTEENIGRLFVDARFTVKNGILIPKEDTVEFYAKIREPVSSSYSMNKDFTTEPEKMAAVFIYKLMEMYPAPLNKVVLHRISQQVKEIANSQPI